MHTTTLSIALLFQGLQRGTNTAAGAGLPLSDGPDLGWLMGVVAALVLAVAGLAFGIRKVLLVTVKQRAAKRELQIVDMLPLGGKRQLAVVRCYDRTFALGLGEKDVSLVAELDHAAVEHDRQQREEERSAAFKERLTAARDRLLGSRGDLEEVLERAEALEPVAAVPAPKPSATGVRSGATHTDQEVVQREVAPTGGPANTREFIA